MTIQLAIYWAFMAGGPLALVVMTAYFWKDVAWFLRQATTSLQRQFGLTDESAAAEADLSWLAPMTAEQCERLNRSIGDAATAGQLLPKVDTSRPFRARRRDSRVIYEVVPRSQFFVVSPIARAAGRSSYTVPRNEFWEMFEPL